MRVESGAFGGAGGGVTELEVSSMIADSYPFYLRNFIQAGDIGAIVAGGLDITQALNRLFTTAGFSTRAGWLVIEDIEHLNDFALLQFGVGITRLIFNQANPITWVWTPATMSGLSLKITGPGAAGVIECKGSNPGAVSWTISAFHGYLEIEDLTVLGDPNIALPTADSSGFLSVSGFFYGTMHGFRLSSYRGVTFGAVFYSGLTDGFYYGNQIGATGVGGTSQLTANVNILGHEFGLKMQNWIFTSFQLPTAFTIVDKTTGTTPAIFRDQSDTAAAAGAGDIWEAMQFADLVSAAIAINPQSGGVVGPQFFNNCYVEGNAGGSFGAGAINFQGVNGGVTVRGGRIRLNGAGTTPAINAVGNLLGPILYDQLEVDFGFGFFFQNIGGQVGFVDMHACITDTPGGRVPILATATILDIGGVGLNKPQRLEERFNGVWSDYLTVNASGAGQGLLAQIDSTSTVSTIGDTSTIIVKVCATSAKATSVIGNFPIAIAANGYGPVARRNQHGLNFISDGAGAIAAGNALLPSTATAGEVAVDAAGTNTIGVAEAGAVAVAGTAFSAFMN
jgi:hypothetical protein